ncbi:diamine N-acetyltransferase [Pseudochelatococcus lubricantis]|uniref:Diamine N-acetyltransferase n=1 Tax=Pseudochelatococcus lubricantis TaxID=1538102 RepID=A0ABX0UXF6_9HYPH|nr:GNAT family N-acetyltransferase [Pseudochelatococcus lubricantis]NIJ57632.1 diamine N-acetyltransferase [Pseudochelatococcus lubricantis]
MDRETSPPPAVRLVPVTAANREAVVALELAPGQVDWLAGNAESLDEADHDPDARPRVVMAQARIVGFLMYEAPADDDEARIYRFMIDSAVQGRGYGRAALRAALEEIATLGHVRRVSICYMPDNEGARRLYGAAGFLEEGLDEDGEMVVGMSLPAGGNGL